VGREGKGSSFIAFSCFPPTGISTVNGVSADTQAAVHLSMMTLPKGKSADSLQIALRAARENEARWMEMSPEISADCDRMEQWASTAKLRRLEIERIETLLAEVENPSPGPTLR
jgi:hypothetical protein